MKEIELYGDGIGKVSYVQHVGNDKMIANAARVSFGNDNTKPFTKRDEKLVKYLIEHKHTSPFEHNSITFLFEVPMFVRSQHMRHRTWAYNEISRRYTDVDLRFYEPKQFRTQHKSNRQASNINDLQDPKIKCRIPGAAFDLDVLASKSIKRHHSQSLNLFDDLIEAGVCREQARGVLPQNLYAKYYGTVNLGNLLKFVDLRIHEGAQWEIQKVAEACLDIATVIWPFSVGAYREIRGA
jgi:thymidylate synthase (FAD)